MAFIDGENLVCCYQRMLKKGRTRSGHVEHQENVFVWNRAIDIVRYGMFEILRAHYYASLVGDTDAVDALVTRLKQCVFVQSNFNSTFNQLYPVIFKKPDNSNKSSTVDIQLATDMLSHVYQDNVDVVMLFSGDGDFEAVVREVIRRGKRVIIAAFSNGLSLKLRSLADRFIDLDPVYFEK